MKTTTRNQLRGYGLSRYQARTLTESLAPIDQEKRLNIYSLHEVIGAIRQRLENRRLTLTTREKLTETIQELTRRLGNVVSVPFQKGGDRTSEKAFKALESLSEYESEINAKIATLKGKRNG